MDRTELKHLVNTQAKAADDLLRILFPPKERALPGASLVRHFQSEGHKIVVVFNKWLRTSSERQVEAGPGDIERVPYLAVVELTPSKVRALVDAYIDTLGERQSLTYQGDRPNTVYHFQTLHRRGLGQGIVDNFGSWLEARGLAVSGYQQYGPTVSFAGHRRGYKYYTLSAVGKAVGEYLSKEVA
jgi:hypothetical protein